MNPMFFDYLSFLFRWGHFLFGVAWIGMLWYFNFVQGAYFAEADAAAKTDATKKLVPRALWYFRWGAVGTFLTGLLILGLLGHRNGMGYFATTKGALITIGALMGTIMFLNVWLVIWPRQQKVIAAANGEKIDNLPVLARRAFLASRTNTLFSIPMLFFMGASSHLPIMDHDMSLFYIIAAAVIGLVEVNALTATQGPTTKPIEKPVGVIHMGLLLAVVLFLVAQFL